MSSVRHENASDAIRTRSFSVADYHRMIDAGILREDDRVELLEGAIVEVSPQDERHARVIQQLTRALVRGLPDSFVVRSQLPLTLDDSEPEPDLAVVRAEHAVSRDEHPRQAVLVIEVSGPSLRHDRAVKSRVYAKAGIPEFWIGRLDDRVIEIHRDPDPVTGRYGSNVMVGQGSLSPAAIPGFNLPLDTVFA